jgi:hypothetical protein
MMSNRSDNLWETLRHEWYRLQTKPLRPADVFNDTAQVRISRSIAQEAIKAPGEIARRKRARKKANEPAP